MKFTKQQFLAISAAAFGLCAALPAQAAPEVTAVTPVYERNLTVAAQKCDPGPCTRTYIYDQKVVGYEVTRKDANWTQTRTELLIPSDAKPEVVLQMLTPR